MEVIVWNKIDDINEVSASDVIKAYNIKETDEIFLVMMGTRVTELQFKDTIASNYNIDANLSCEEVAQKYLEIKQQEEQKQQEEALNLQKQQDEINSLKKQNAELMYMMMQNQGGTI